MTTGNVHEQIAVWVTEVQSYWGLLEKSVKYTLVLSNLRGVGGSYSATPIDRWLRVAS